MDFPQDLFQKLNKIHLHNTPISTQAGRSITLCILLLIFSNVYKKNPKFANLYNSYAKLIKMVQWIHLLVHSLSSSTQILHPCRLHSFHSARQHSQRAPNPVNPSTMNGFSNIYVEPTAIWDSSQMGFRIITSVKILTASS